MCLGICIADLNRISSIYNPHFTFIKKISIKEQNRWETEKYILSAIILKIRVVWEVSAYASNHVSKLFLGIDSEKQQKKIIMKFITLLDFSKIEKTTVWPSCNNSSFFLDICNYVSNVRQFDYVLILYAPFFIFFYLQCVLEDVWVTYNI